MGLQPVTRGDPDAVTWGDLARWAGPYGAVLMVCVLIWVITSVAAGHPTYFWPVWMLIPLLVGTAGQCAAHRRHGR